MPLPLAIPLIAAGLGTAGKMVGAIKAGKAAKDFRRLEKEIPGAQTEMIGATQSRINANPLAAAAQRRQQTAAANTMYQARQVGDQSQILSMLGGMSGQQERGMLEAQMGDEALRDQRMGQYLNALSTVFDQRMANVQSRANLLGAAAQTSSNAWRSAGSALTDMASAMMPFTKFGPANLSGGSSAAGSTATNVATAPFSQLQTPSLFRAGMMPGMTQADMSMDALFRKQFGG